MEIDINQGEWADYNNEGVEFFIINEAIITKLCVLGENVEPCFEGAQIKAQFSYGDKLKRQLFSMIEQLTEILNEGGAKMNEDILVPEVVEEVSTEFEEKKDEVVEETTVAEEVSTEFVEKKDDDIDEETEEEICPDCGKPESECECDKDEKDEDKKNKYNLDEIQEYVELSKEYSALQTQYSTLECDYNTLKADYDKLVEFKLSVEKAKKQQMIDSFYMLSAEDKKDVQDNINTYSIEDIEAKLSIICVRNRVNFNLEEEAEPTTPTVFNLNSVEADSTPAWIKAVQSVAKRDK